MSGRENRTKLAVFDCDGTLIDGQASICEAMESAFAELGLPVPDRGTVRRAVGLSLPQAMRQLLPLAEAGTHRAAAAAYKQAFRALRAKGTLSQVPFAGIATLLDTLRAAGWTLGIATGMSDRGLTHCLAANGLAGHFATLQTADRHPSKPDPAMLLAALEDAGAQPGDSVMIGDTAYDITMAASVGVRAIGVAWGYHATEELLAAGAETVAITPEEIGELLQ